MRMMAEPSGASDELNALRLAAGGDSSAWAELLGPHRARLRRTIELRMDRRLRGRLDASDVLQEATIEAIRVLPRYLEGRELPFFLWMRWMTMMTLRTLHRKHLGVAAREAGREVRIDDGVGPGATSAVLADGLMGNDTQPSLAVARLERKQRLIEAIDALDPIDREVLALRHFEELTAEEVGRVLGIERSAASKRYLRAVRRLKGLLESLPGGEEGFRL